MAESREHFALGFRLVALYQSAGHCAGPAGVSYRHRCRRCAGLKADQFEISDAGARRPITQFSVERVPISLGILLDISGSMARDPQARAADGARWADTRRALELLVTRLDPRDEVLFGVFADKVALALSWTRAHGRIVRAFDGLRPGGGTSLFEAVKLIAPALRRAQHQRKMLLLVTDGLDNAIAAGPPMPTNTDAAETQRIQHMMKRKAAAAESKAAVRASVTSCSRSICWGSSPPSQTEKFIPSR